MAILNFSLKIIKTKRKKYITSKYQYDSIKTTIKNNTLLSTSIPITSKYIEFGDHFFFIKRKFPDHTIKFLKENSDIKILCFKFKKYDIKIYCKVHFYLNKAFMICYKIPYTNYENQLKII